MIDINTASADELDAVPMLRGHGFEIVRYRDERGGFTSLRQLDEVPGLVGKTTGVTMPSRSVSIPFEHFSRPRLI